MIVSSFKNKRSPYKPAHLLRDIFLGSKATFHNQHRKWMYLIFLIGIAALVIYVAVKGQA